MNIYDISRKAGVSIATVSRVVNGDANVSDAMRARVLAVAQPAWLLLSQRMMPGLPMW